jgi:uncharacterized protein (TIGR03435 family)
MRLSLVAVLVALPFVPPRLDAQSALNAPVFEVTSVKPSKPGSRLRFVPGSPGRFTMTNVSVRTLVQNAYQLLQDAQVVGGPNWLTSERFDVVAKAAGNPSPDEMALMLRALLAERFKLVAHTETRELPMYALVLARRDRKLGERIRPTAVDCSKVRDNANGRLTNPSQVDDRMFCGIRFSPGNVVAGGISLSQLGERLAPFVDRAVVDRTGLAARFDLNLEWTPDQWRTAQVQNDGLQPAPTNPGGPSLFTAVQEQLGLKLESARGPVDVLVIDSVSQPLPD